MRRIQLADNVDITRLNKAIDENAAIHAKLLKVNVAHIEKVKAELTAEQKVFFNNHPRMGSHNNGYRGNRGNKGNRGNRGNRGNGYRGQGNGNNGNGNGNNGQGRW